MDLKFSPHRAFCEAVRECLGSAPSVRFLESYWDDVEGTPYTFLSRLIQAWVTEPFARVHAPEVEGAGRARLAPDVLSVVFLLKVEPERFLEFAYLDVLGRPLGAADLAGYEGVDFSAARNRIAVLDAMIRSPEAEGRSLRFASEEDHRELVSGRRIEHGGIADLPNMIPLASGVLMGKTAGLGSYDTKFPLLWKVQGSGSLFCAFGMVVNIASDGGLPVSESEWVFFGPKGPLPAGQYNLRLEISGRDGDLFHFDVVHRGGTMELKSIKFFGSIDTKLLITLDDDVDDIEVRLANLNGRTVSVDVGEVSLAPVAI